MKVLSLQALREQQKAAGLSPDVYTPEPGSDLTTNEKLIPTKLVVVQQIQTPKLGLRGYTRILPPGKRSVAELTGDWIIEFWDKPSPWCSIEGEPVHPEFEANLKSFEGAA